MVLLGKETSPQALARLGGFLYLIIIIAGLYCEFFARGSLIVPGNAMATASSIRSHEWLWRTGIAVDLFTCACTVVLAWVFYTLLRPAHRDLALLMVFFDLIAICLQIAFDLNLAATLFPLGDAAYLKVFSPEQLAVLARLAIRAHGTGWGISLLFFGFTFPIRGYLIIRSRILPKALGILLVIAGCGYVLHGFTALLAPALAGRIFPFVAVPILIGEASTCLWLLFKGVNVAVRGLGAD
ncbi:MAG: DUF4386 domain-containing protein [Geothrix sp.]|nr:DUF4386 domain-containing protein [Geothrix sp.]